MSPSKVEVLREQKEKLKSGGGAEKIQSQHEKGKLTARERLNLLFDKNSFVEVGLFVKHRCTDFGMAGIEAPGEGVVTGYGTIDGRRVFAYAQDFTVIGGSLGLMHAEKIVNVMDMALKMGAPVIGLNDSGGARIQEGVDALSGYGKIFKRNTISSGVIPQISAIMGPCAGGAVYSPAITDFIFMVDQTSQMFITGPQVIQTVTGEEISAEALGGAQTHNTVSGVAHFRSVNDTACIQDIKRLLSFLPSNNLEKPPVVETPDDVNRIDEGLDEIVPESPSKPYDMKKIIKSLADSGDFLEVQSGYAKNIIIGFIRIGGATVGVVANQPIVRAGCLDINSSDKGARFIRTCDAFNIPLLNLVDVPGFLPGKGQEHGGVIRHGAKMLFAYSESTVPKVTLIIRKAYGGAYIGMCNKELGADAVLAWPSAEIAVMGPDGAANVIFKKQIQAAPDPQAARGEKIDEYRDKFSNPYIAAARGYIDDIIEPRFTRSRLSACFAMLSTKKESLPPKKHGNLPV
ncbi:MAG: carboxyl transferase domain-containing protein [Desulfobacterales bacterium]|nr:carboxyl transferase domain-containing protein [Desulfobacterales bacterium]